MDNLEILEGVGPATAKVLAEAGLTSFAAIAALTPLELESAIGAKAKRLSSADFAAIVRSAAAAERDRVEAASVATADETPAPASPAPPPDAPPESADRESGGSDPAAPAIPLFRLRVTGPRAGRRRIGRHFGPEPVEIEVSADEADEIAADPKLRHEVLN